MPSELEPAEGVVAELVFGKEVDASGRYASGVDRGVYFPGSHVGGCFLVSVDLKAEIKTELRGHEEAVGHRYAVGYIQRDIEIDECGLHFGG